MARKNTTKSAQVETNLVPEVEANLVPEVEMVPEVESAPEVETKLPSILDQIQSLQTAVEAAPVAKTEAKGKVKNENVWGNVKLLFQAGKTNKEVLAEIHEMYGNTQTSYACIAWYRNKFNKEAKSGKMTVEQLLNQVACQFGQDQDWVKSQLAKV